MTTNNRAMSNVAERQMRKWAHDVEHGQQLAKERQQVELKDLIYPYIVVSRETGVNAADLSRAVAEKCGWKLFDRELLDYMAEHDHLSRLALEFVDERAVSWFHEMFGTWLEKQLVSQAEYVSRLGKILLLQAQDESSVFVGRGAQFMLPRERGLRVRVIAPIKQRIRTIMNLRACGEREAREYIETTDREREQFVQRYFHHDLSDPHLYNLVINLGYIPRDEAVDIIARAAERLAARAETAHNGDLTQQVLLNRAQLEEIE